jgi:low temperature requirement protein LtrA
VSELHTEYEHRVTPLELFFDLVFVFGFTQVTTLLVHHSTWAGLGHALLLLAVLWWPWAGYAWLTNTVDADEGVVRGALLLAMGAMFVAALAAPEAFGRHGVVFGVALLLVAAMHLALYTLAGRGDPDLLGAVLRIAPTNLAASALILGAGFADGALRSILWAAALLVGYIGPLCLDVRGWRVHAGHFAERHGLILIIALGESLIAIGIGASGVSLGAGEILAAALGFLIAIALWLAYFDFFAIRGEQLLSRREGAERVAFARDAYTYLHLPMVVGIVLFALAMRKTLADVHGQLGTIPAICLCGGTALYLFSYVALRLRITRTLGRGRFIAAIALAALLPAALHVPALAALALVAAVWVALHGYELLWWREARAETRALRAPATG